MNKKIFKPFYTFRQLNRRFIYRNSDSLDYRI